MHASNAIHSSMTHKAIEKLFRQQIQLHAYISLVNGPHATGKFGPEKILGAVALPKVNEKSEIKFFNSLLINLRMFSQKSFLE